MSKPAPIHHLGSWPTTENYARCQLPQRDPRIAGNLRGLSLSVSQASKQILFRRDLQINDWTVPQGSPRYWRRGSGTVGMLQRIPLKAGVCPHLARRFLANSIRVAKPGVKDTHRNKVILRPVGLNRPKVLRPLGFCPGNQP